MEEEKNNIVEAENNVEAQMNYEEETKQRPIEEKKTVMVLGTLGTGKSLLLNTLSGVNPDVN